MLAYLLWHWPLPDTDVAAYEQAMIDFHRSLAAAQPAGFLESTGFRSSGVPWAASGGPTYEDWYLLEGSAAMDILNDLAVSGDSKIHHDTAAGAVEAASAGLYTLRVGSADLAAARACAWLAKPRGMTYQNFFASIEPWTSAGDVAVLRRQMVLGPTPEFCLLSPQQLDLPASMGAVHCRLAPVSGSRFGVSRSV
jgi:hypothetical protein